MTTYVLGAGIVGVTTAYFLAKAGHEVVVVDGAEAVGTGATNSNAGMIAPSDAIAWTTPEAPARMFKALVGRSADVRLGSSMFIRNAPWGMRFLRNCTRHRYERNTLARLEICLYSQQVMNALVDAENLRYQQTRDRGILFLYSDRHSLDEAAQRAQVLAEHGHKIEVLSAEAAVNLEPALRPRLGSIAGAVHGITDSIGDARLFTEQLVRRCEGLGVRFELGQRIEALERRGDRVVAAHAASGRLVGERFVLCLGSGSARLARTIGLRLPILPVKGYCAEYRIRPDGNAPRMGGVDEKRLVAWSPLGDRLRFTTGAEFGVSDATVSDRAIEPIRQTIAEFFPTAADYDRGQVRPGLRPVTPAGPPLVGQSRYEGLYLNTGHGSMGWTMGCGTARIITDVIDGRTPEIMGSRWSEYHG